MMRRRTFLGRGLCLSLPILATACAGEAPPPPMVFAPLRYDYLLPLRLNVANWRIQNSFLPDANDLGNQSPVSPVAALSQMAHDRLQADGSAGQATFTIVEASIHRFGENYQGRMRVRLDIVTPNGAPAAFSEARVTRALSGVGPQPKALYQLVKQMMDDMNVELEHQLRRSLNDWLLPAGDSSMPVRQKSL